MYNLFVAHNLGASLTVVEVVRDAHHASGAEVVGGCRFDGASASHAAENLHRGARGR